MSSIINGFIVFSLIITCAFLLGLLTLINDRAENACEMTFMFEYPQYVRISQELDEKYPKYGLYAYSEGRLTEKSRNMYFDGIPALFIPGNAGSHRQARSMASVALRKALDSRTRFHFDHFVLDLNHEFGGLNGALLQEQLEYANGSLYRILSLYEERKNPQKSIILYAHSVGGIIARRLVTSLPESSTLIPIVLSLATPHRRSPLMLDSYTYNFYQSGYNDLLVSSFLTTITDPDALNVVVSQVQYWENLGTFTQFSDFQTTQIPRSWTTADHVCIIWCKQTILAITRALFDSVNPKTLQISTDPKFRDQIFRHHLIHHNGLRPFLNYENSRANIRNVGEWIEYLGRQYTINVPRFSNSPHFYMLRLINQPQHEVATVVAIDLETVEWAFVCGAHIPRDKLRVCEEFTHLSHFSELVPSRDLKRRLLQINMHELMKNNSDWTHVVLRVLPNDDEVTLNVDIYDPNDRKIVVNLPHMLSLKRQTIIPETVEKSVHYELVLPNLYHMIQSYQLYVDSLQCTDKHRHTTATLIVPWAHQNQHKHFTETDSEHFTVRLYESRPQKFSNQSAVIRLTLDPTCRYKVSIRSSIPGILGQMTRFYSPLLIANIAVVVLMTLNSQMKSMSKDRVCSLFFVAIMEGAKPYYILTTVKLISRFLSFKPFLNILPAPDWLIMSQEGTDFFLLPLLLYICSVGIVWILGIVLCVSLVVCETTVHKLALKFLAKTVSFTVSWSDHIMSALHKLPCVVALGLIFLTLTTTGSLALCVGTVFYFMRLTQLSQDYIEELVWSFVKRIGQKFKRTKLKEENEQNIANKNEDEQSEEKKPNNNNNNNESETATHDAMFFHATIFFLWCIVTVINIPSVLTWAHNFKYSTSLKPDPSFIPGLILSVCSFPLWQLDLPKIERRGYGEIGHCISVLAVVSLIYAPISIFRLNYTLTATVVVVTLHQLVAPNRDLSIPEPRREFPITYEMIKAKLE